MSQTMTSKISPAIPWYQRKQARDTLRAAAIYAIILPGALMFLTPLLWMVSTALKQPNQIFIYPPQWIPDPPQWNNFVDGWNAYLPFNLFLRNSLLITINNVVGNLFSCCLAAYGFARDCGPPAKPSCSASSWRPCCCPRR